MTTILQSTFGRPKLVLRRREAPPTGWTKASQDPTVFENQYDFSARAPDAVELAGRMPSDARAIALVVLWHRRCGIVGAFGCGSEV